jgi:type II secretory pathway pseudopilin PulG
MSNYFNGKRAAYTLVELLIVIMIAILLMVIALPMAKTIMEDARPREASRILNAMIAGTKARAAQSGRPAGIEFVTERMNDPGVTNAAYQCTQMYMCEVPPIYMGDLTDSRVVVNTSMNPWRFNFQNNCDQNLPSLLDSTGDFWIRIDHRGPWYPATRSGSNYDLEPARWPANTPVPYPPTYDTSGYSFQIRRNAVRVGNPVELPRSTAIDMSYSGLGPLGVQFNNALGLRIMFAPAGNVEEMTLVEPNPMSPQPGMPPPPPIVTTTQPFGTIHFLVGVTTKIYPAQDDTMGPYNFNVLDRSNLIDGNALWVSIGRMSGVVTTNENNIGYVVTDPTDAMQKAALLTSSRQFATAREQKGGR